MKTLRRIYADKLYELSQNPNLKITKRKFYSKVIADKLLEIEYSVDEKRYRQTFNVWHEGTFGPEAYWKIVAYNQSIFNNITRNVYVDYRSIKWE